MIHLLLSTMDAYFLCDSRLFTADPMFYSHWTFARHCSGRRESKVQSGKGCWAIMDVSSRGENNGASWGQCKGMAFWGGFMTERRIRGMKMLVCGTENEWPSRVGRVRDFGGSEGVWRCSTGVQGFSWKIAHSCCEFTAQHTSREEPHFLFTDHSELPVGPDHPNVTSQWPQTEMTLRPKGKQRENSKEPAFPWHFSSQLDRSKQFTPQVNIHPFIHTFVHWWLIRSITHTHKCTCTPVARGNIWGSLSCSTGPRYISQLCLWG